MIYSIFSRKNPFKMAKMSHTLLCVADFVSFIIKQKPSVLSAHSKLSKCAFMLNSLRNKQLTRSTREKNLDGILFFHEDGSTEEVNIALSKLNYGVFTFLGYSRPLCDINSTFKSPK